MQSARGLQDSHPPLAVPPTPVLGRPSRMRGSSGRSAGKLLLRAVWPGAAGVSPRPLDSPSAECLARLISRGALDAQASGRFAAAEATSPWQRRGVSCSAYTGRNGSNGGRSWDSQRAPQSALQSTQDPVRPERFVGQTSKYHTTPHDSMSLEERKQELEKQLRAAKIYLKDGYHAGRHQRQGFCPYCHGGEKKDNSFQCNIAEDYTYAKWWCYRAAGCGKEGSLRLGGTATVRESPPDSVAGSGAVKGPRQGLSEVAKLSDDAPWAAPEGLAEEAGRVKELGTAPAPVLNFLKERGISRDVAEKCGVGYVVDRGGKSEGQGFALAFRYYKDGKVVNIKYRSVGEKRFWQSPGGLRMLYGLEDLPPNAETIIIVEGEMDRLAFEQAGISNVVSIPDGAVAKAKDQKDVDTAAQLAKTDLNAAESVDRKFSYLWAAMPVIDKVNNVVIATDADGPGQITAEELARRIGKEKCWRARFDKITNGEVGEDGKPVTAKDANDVLMRFGGASKLEMAVTEAQEWPIDGLFGFDKFRDEVFKLFDNDVDEAEFGVSTGWEVMNDFYRVVPGELCIVTGVPNSGKSEWIDALMVNLASNFGWTFALCSMENRVRDHARKLAEKYMNKSFFGGSRAWYSTDAMRQLSRQELEQAMGWIEAHFCLIRRDADAAMMDIDWILQRATMAVRRYGIRGLVIDPYNELEHRRPPNQTETEYVSQLLSKVKRFAQNHGVHVWFVAHPKQLSNWNPDEPPQLYDISGSAHFVNKADVGIVVHRYRSKEQMGNVEIHVRKVRNKLAGSIGMCKLDYDPVSGRYTERQEYIAEHKALKEMELNKVQEQRRAAAAPAALPAPGAGLAHAGQVSLEHSAGAGQQARVAAGGAN